MKIIHKPVTLIKFVKDRPGHDFRYSVDTTKIKNELKWTPKINVEDGLKNTIKWYQDNEPWWRKIKNAEYQSYYALNYESKFIS